jgi:SAM-dependent methyltransferase
VRRLNLGCGLDLRHGWVNVDREFPDLGTGDYEFRRGDARDLAFPGDEFDVVLLNHVLHLFTYDVAEAVLDECVRVLAPGGELVIVDADVLRVIGLYGYDAIEFGPHRAQVPDWLPVAVETESTDEGRLLRWAIWHGTRLSLWSYGMLAERLLLRGVSVTRSPSKPITIGRENESFTIVGVKP